MTEGVVRLLYVHAAAGPWQPLYPGVDVKTLHHDPAQNLHVMLMRYQPGAVMLRHRRLAVEQGLFWKGASRMSLAPVTMDEF